METCVYILDIHINARITNPTSTLHTKTDMGMVSHKRSGGVVAMAVRSPAKAKIVSHGSRRESSRRDTKLRRNISDYGTDGSLRPKDDIPIVQQPGNQDATTLDTSIPSNGPSGGATPETRHINDTIPPAEDAHRTSGRGYLAI